MILRMENLKFGSPMGIFTKAILKLMPCKVKERFIFTLGTSTKAAFKEACCTTTVFTSTQMVIFMTVLGKLIKSTEKVNKLMQMVQSMMAVGKTIKNTAKVYSSMRTGKNTTETGKRTKDTDMGR